MPKVISSCPMTPDLSSKSKYCVDHSYLQDEDKDEQASKKPRIVININVVDQKISTRFLEYTEDLPSSEDSSIHVGCKQEKNVDKFYDRSAGIMALVKPCGMIIDATEMLTCESPSQLFVQLLRLCDSNVNIRCLGYDRACEFKPFLKNMEKKGNEGAGLLLSRMTFVVDRFHIKGHTAPKCTLGDPKCEYHPELEEFKLYSTVNTECAEQAFAWLGKFKHAVKYMTHYRFVPLHTV